MAGYDFAAGWARSGIQDMLSVPGHAAAGLPPGHHRPRLVDADLRRHVRGALPPRAHRRGPEGGVQPLPHRRVDGRRRHHGRAVRAAAPARRPQGSANPFYDVYECKDGRWLQLTAADRYAKAHDPVGAKFWQSFCRVLDRPDLADDPRFATTDMRQQHRDVLTPMINEAFLRAPTRSGRSACAPRTSCTARSSRPSRSSRTRRRWPTTSSTRSTSPASARSAPSTRRTSSCRTRPTIQSITPGLGEQTDEILGELGYSTSGINELREAKVIL